MAGLAEIAAAMDAAARRGQEVLDGQPLRGPRPRGRAHRAEVIAGARRDLAAARDAARTALVSAQSTAARARREHRTQQADIDDRLAAVATERERTVRHLEETFRDRVVRLGRELDALAARCAAGSAGASWRTWRPDWTEQTRRRHTEPPTGTGGETALLRIGSVIVERSLPALVPLLDRGHLWLSGPPDAPVDGVIAGVLLRVLGAVEPGQVRLSVYDPKRLGASLAPFAPLAGAGLLTFVPPTGLGELFDDLAGHINRINGSVLAGTHTSLAALAEATGDQRPEPWRIVVLLPDDASTAELTEQRGAQLERIIRTGVSCGVHLIGYGLPAADHPDLFRIAVHGATATCSTTGDLPVKLDPPPPTDRVTAVARTIADRVLAGPPPAEFEDLQPARLWTESSAHALVAPLGDGPDGRLVEVLLGDDPPHALVAGPSGSGKTNLIHAWLAALCCRYSPDELALHLLDFSDGVSFARFAPSDRDPSWLPQARVIGVNLDADRGLGVTLLRQLAMELRRRARLARSLEAGKLAEMRAEDPQGRWPRIVAVIDEFQVLLSGDDAPAAEATELLGELARRGRAQGVHLILATQDVSGARTLWTHPALAEQFTLRIALPKARGVLAEANLAAQVIPRFHAVVNAHAGLPTANRIVRLPDAGDRPAWRRLRDRLWQACPPGLPAPLLFDGDAPPTSSPADAPPTPSPADAPAPLPTAAEPACAQPREVPAR